MRPDTNPCLLPQLPGILPHGWLVSEAASVAARSATAPRGHRLLPLLVTTAVWAARRSRVSSVGLPVGIGQYPLLPAFPAAVPARLLIFQPSHIVGNTEPSVD